MKNLNAKLVQLTGQASKGVVSLKLNKASGQVTSKDKFLDASAYNGSAAQFGDFEALGVPKMGRLVIMFKDNNTRYYAFPFRNNMNGNRQYIAINSSNTKDVDKATECLASSMLKANGADKRAKVKAIELFNYASFQAAKLI